ncbi:MAG: hypothetical protein RLZZ387_4078 [Chloroflexota bacterium]|jgi:hypothetical protein
MLVFLLLVGVLVAAAVYLVRHGLFLQLLQFLHALRTHWLVSGLLLSLSALGGVVLWRGVNSTPEASLLFACPLLAGGCAGWWELRRDTTRPYTQRIVGHSILAGLLATALPALALVLSTALSAWRTGELVGEAGWWAAPWIESLGWGAGIVALGIILSMMGAIASTMLAQLPLPPDHRGPKEPTA